jgi:ATP-dependent helicase HrpB
MQPLPIDSYLAEIASAVVRYPITLIDAPPGTGKTTRVAPALLDHFNQSNQKVYLLQPRRLAARSVAARIAQERGEPLGNTIGYSVRLDHQVSRSTRLIIATEGILIRRMQEDPAIEDTAVVILDEFHERSLDADLLFAMLRRVQLTLRPELRIVIMSATLDPAMVADKLPDAPIIRVPSLAFPVSIRYSPPRSLTAPMHHVIVEHMADTVADVIMERPGDVLAFLPGAGEIHRCRERLDAKRVGQDWDIVPLYGSMSMEDQMRAIETGPRPRIVLATNIAETSLTIPSIKTVIDSGLARVMRYSPDVGLDRLVLENISSASATQRAGRAGRVAPGVCIRLWSEASERARSPFLDPEIRRVDLASAVLQLFAWGEGTSTDFPWLEPPREDGLASAKRLLELLGAVSENRVTPLGRNLARLPLHPRLGRMAVAAMEMDCIDEACWLAAMLAERDPFDRKEPNPARSRMATTQARRWDSDSIERLYAIRHPSPTRERTPFGYVQPGAVRNIEQSARQIRQIMHSLNPPAASSIEPTINPSKGTALPSRDTQLMQALLAGFPDRLAKRRETGRQRGLMVGGKGIQVDPQSGVHEPELFVCIEVESAPGDACVRQASRVDLEWLQGPNLRECDELFFHPTQKQVVARHRTYWIDLLLNETPTAIRDDEGCAETLWNAVKANWDTAFPKDDPATAQWLARIECLRTWMPELELPTLSPADLHSVARDVCRGKRSLDEVRRGEWLDWLRHLLTPRQAEAVDREAPARIQVPSGSWVRLDYEPGKAPILAVKIQEVFSWQQTPRIAAGRIPLLLHLLAPSMRPQQITDDLASFWRVGYAEVKKELKRRYPKHSWPDDPTRAPATRR